MVPKGSKTGEGSAADPGPTKVSERPPPQLLAGPAEEKGEDDATIAEGSRAATDAQPSDAGSPGHVSSSATFDLNRGVEREADAGVDDLEGGEASETSATAQMSHARSIAETGADEAGASRSTTRSTTALASATRSTSVVSPGDTLHLEEIRRTRAFTSVSLPFAIAVLCSLPLFGGHPVAKATIAVGMVLIALTAFAVKRMLRTDDGYTTTRILFFALVCVLGAQTGIFFFGVFSPAAAVIPFGLYFFSVGQSFRGTLAIYLACALSYAVMAIAVMLGYLPDLGLIRADDVSLVDRATVFALVELTFGATFVTARASRRAMLSAIEQHDKDLRALAQREALLKEARQELERALEAGGLGRFSDQELGSFKLGRVIGRGGMGEVYAAVHTSSGAPAALKLLHSPALSDPAPVRRFIREAKIASSLAVPNVVRVLEIGGTEAPVPYIAMELLSGQDLSEILRKKRRLPLKRVVDMVRQIGRGLDAARDKGIVHRDLKPRNLFLADEGGARETWKILDFGVSKLVDTQGTLTQNMMVGTPSYMAPEQASGDAVDHRADLYALGVIAYRSLTGRPAFPGDAIAEILYKVLHTMPPRPSDLAQLSSAVDAVLVIALAKRPSERFQTVAEMVDAFEAARTGELDEALWERARELERRRPWGSGR